MNTMNKFIIISIMLLSGCTIGDNLDRRYTKEITVPVKTQLQDVCLSLPIQADEIIISAITYNVKSPQHQIIFPQNKQATSGFFCISPNEYTFTSGQEYITFIEVNKVQENEGGNKSTRKVFSAAFSIVKSGDTLTANNIDRK